MDEQGNETLFEILLTIDGKEEFGKNYVLLIPANAEEDENGEVEIQAYSFTENEDGTEGDLQPIPEDSRCRMGYDQEKSSTALWRSDTVTGDCITSTQTRKVETSGRFSPTLETRKSW